ncbi:hypothetical protein RJZ90_000957 [Blastomyces dermatitidis]
MAANNLGAWASLAKPSRQGLVGLINYRPFCELVMQLKSDVQPNMSVPEKLVRRHSLTSRINIDRTNADKSPTWKRRYQHLSRWQLESCQGNLVSIWRHSSSRFGASPPTTMFCLISSLAKVRDLQNWWIMVAGQPLTVKLAIDNNKSIPNCV